jgi:hypothetical protein
MTTKSQQIATHDSPDPEDQENDMSTKPARIRQRRTLADGRKLINVVCPLCDRQHWMREADVGDCPRRPGRFTIASDAVRVR